MRLPGVVLVAALVWGPLHGCSSSTDGADGGAARAPDTTPDAGADASAGGARPSGEQSCSERYELLADLATDLETRLTWTRFVAVDALTHADAATRCATRGMRLPTRPELASLMLTEDAPGRDADLRHADPRLRGSLGRHLPGWRLGERALRRAERLRVRTLMV